MRTELALGITGGVFGLIFTLVSYFFSGIAFFFSGVADRTAFDYLVVLLLSGIFGSIIGIIGSAIGVAFKPKAGGITTLFGSVLIGLTFFAYFLNIVPFVLLVCAGVMLLRHKPKPVADTTAMTNVTAPSDLPPDLSSAEYLVLRAIRQGADKPKSIATLLSMDENDVKRIIEELTYKGFITKKRKLTTKGLDILKYAVVIGLIPMLLLGNILMPVIPSTAYGAEVKYLINEELVTAKARWITKSDDFEETITIYAFPYITSNYSFLWKPFSLGEIKDPILTGTATEKSNPKIPFNFYIFDEVNFELWQAKRDYIPYYEARNVTSTTFSVQFSNKVPDTLYLVVEAVVTHTSKAEAPIVQVTGEWQWLEANNYKWDYTGYLTVLTPLFPYLEFNVPTLKVEAKEINGTPFNLYILDSHNYSNWNIDKPYKAYYIGEKVTTANFSMQLPNEALLLYIVIENISEEANKDITVSITAMVTDAETTTVTDANTETTRPSEFKIRVGGISESIVVNGTITTGSVKSIYVDQPSNSLIVKLDGVVNDGEMTITLPPEIIQRDEQYRFNGATFSVHATAKDGIHESLVPLNFTDKKEADYSRLITIEVPAGTEEVIITLDNVRVVPEFGLSVAMLILAVVMVGILAAARRGLIPTTTTTTIKGV
ncbi:MAG: MarR family winged helix-turn-helix transcriptional regulator [Candidatus Nitrosocaldus sp.]